MTPQQQVALGYPCLVAEECANQRYGKVYRKGRRLISTLLTVNVGEE